jgi:hypothetical protein
MSDTILNSYFNDVERFLKKNLNDFDLKNVSGIQEGDKHISKMPVGGRYYKEYTLEYSGVIDGYSDRENFKNKGRDIKGKLVKNYSSKYFRNNDDEYCVIHINEKNLDDGVICLKAHCIPDPE